VRITRNKIKNNLKAYRIIARRSERERKKAVKALRRAKEFILMDMLEAIPNPEKTTTNANIDLQLREALIAIATDIIDLGLDDSIVVADYKMDIEVQEGDYIALADNIALQVDFIGLDIGWEYLDVDDDVDTGLF
jgi:hypothetical protein